MYVGKRDSPLSLSHCKSGLYGRGGQIRTGDPLLPKQVRYGKVCKPLSCNNLAMRTNHSESLLPEQLTY